MLENRGQWTLAVHHWMWHRIWQLQHLHRPIFHPIHRKLVPISCNVRTCSSNEDKTKTNHIQISNLNFSVADSIWHIPWSIEFDECIFSVVCDDIFKVLGNGNGDGSIVFGWDWLTLLIWLQFSAFQILQECVEIFNSIRTKKVQKENQKRLFIIFSMGYELSKRTYENSSFMMNFWLRSSRAKMTGLSPV